jgi:nickel transport protein
MGRTDAQGRLRFELPGELSDGWELQVDAGPGHRDYLELPEDGGGRSLQDGGQATVDSVGRGALLSWRSTGLGRLLAQRPAPATLPLVGGLAMGLSAVGVILFQRRRR